MNDETRASQLAENMRFYGDMRFKQLTLFMAAMTAVAGGIASSSQYRWWIAMAGLWVAAVMWVMEVRSTVNFSIMRNEAEALWPQGAARVFPWLTATRAVGLLYAASYGFWLSCIRIWCRTCCASFYIGLLVGMVLVVFWIANDPSLWKSK